MRKKETSHIIMVFANESTAFVGETLINAELERDRRYHPNLGGITRGGLANHYPMTLLALRGLGASEDEVQSFRKAWPRHRAALDAPLASGIALVDRDLVTADNWPEYLGRSEYLLEFRRVFEGALKQQGLLPTVTRALDVMRDGLPMGLFHPLIRLSFAMSHGGHGLIADALAYMAIRYEDLYRADLPAGTATATDDARTAADVWRALKPTNALNAIVFAKRGASIRICEELVGQPSLHTQALPPDFVFSQTKLTKRMQEITSLALRLYVHTPSLTTLHAVTSAQALAEMTPRHAQPSPVFVDLWKRYWVWLTALFIEKALPDLEQANQATAVDESWSELAARARAIPEVHLIKMAYSCRWLDETFGPDPLYKSAVANMLNPRGRD